MKKLSASLLAIALFLVTQVAVGLVMTYMLHIQDIALAMLVSLSLTIVILALLRLFDWRTAWGTQRIRWRESLLGIAAATLGIVALNIVEEMLQLPNLMEEAFVSMSKTFVGILVITLLGPLAEEIVFRECVLGTLLRQGMRAPIAVAASALVFGLVHLNPAQVPFAIAMGIIFGIIYLKRRNILLTSIIHVLNNSMAVWQMWMLGDDASDTLLQDSLGGPLPACLCALLCAVGCVWFMRAFWREGKTLSEDTTENQLKPSQKHKPRGMATNHRP